MLIIFNIIKKWVKGMGKELFTANGVFSIIGTIIANALGGWSLALQALVMLVIIDYITGVTVAIFERKLSSEVGGRGIAKKVMIFALVYVAVLVDQATNINLVKTITIMFYIANEGISILENAGKIGVPYPQTLKNILVQLKNKNASGKKKGE